jgi:hypothetical protein
MLNRDAIAAVIERHCCDRDFYDGALAAARELADAAQRALLEERARVDALALRYLVGLARTCYIAERDGTMLPAHVVIPAERVAATWEGT